MRLKTWLCVTLAIAGSDPSDVEYSDSATSSKLELGEPRVLTINMSGRGCTVVAPRAVGLMDTACTLAPGKSCASAGVSAQLDLRSNTLRRLTAMHAAVAEEIAVPSGGGCSSSPHLMARRSPLQLLHAWPSIDAACWNANPAAQTRRLRRNSYRVRVCRLYPSTLRPWGQLQCSRGPTY